MTRRYRTPDTIIGIGGAGKSIVERFMKKEYIINEAIRPGENNTDNYRGRLSAFAIDTDTEAKDKDSSEADDIRRLISNVADQYDENLGKKNLDYEYINLVDETDRMRIDAGNLVRKPNVPDIMESCALKCWWLRESDHMIDVADNYTNGVERRRGLGKALFHASQAEQNPIQHVVEKAASGSHTALVAGLGGGTGSGMFLDIGKELQKRGVGNVTLFAILPQTNEGQNVKSNAYAALSELERLAITDENPFTNIVLLPLDPATRYSEFGEAVVQTILSYYNIDNNHQELGDVDDGLTNHHPRLDANAPEGPPMYAPFTVAIPQMLYYVATEVEKSRSRINDFVQNKREELEAEQELYDALEEYIIENCAEEPSRKLDEDNVKTISLTSEQSVTFRENRITPLKELLSVDAFEQLGYTSANRILQKIDEIEKEIEAQYDQDATDQIRREKIERIPEGIYERPNEVRPDDGENFDEDETFANLIIDEIEMLARRRDLLKIVNLIEDDVIRQGVESALNPTITGIAGTTPEEEMRAIQIDEIKSEYKRVTTLQEVASELHEELLTDWQNTVQSDVESLVRINSQIDTVERQISDLASEIQADIQAINNATRAEELPSNQINYHEYKEIDTFLSELGCDPLDVDSLENNVREIITAAEHWYDEHQGGSGIIGKAISLVTGGSSDSFDTYIEISGRLDEQYFELAEWDTPTFYCEFDRSQFDDAVSTIEDRRTEQVTEILDAVGLSADEAADGKRQLESFIREQDRYEMSEQVKDTLDELSYSLPDEDDWTQELQSELHNATDARELLQTQTGEGGLVSELLWSTLVTPIKDLAEEKEEKLEQKQADRKRYDRLDDIIRSESARFVSSLDNVEEPSEIRVHETRNADHFSHRNEIVADEPEKLLGSEDIADANLWESPNEPAQIHNELLNFLERTLTKDSYTALKRGTIKPPGDDEGRWYEGHRLMTVLMSRAFADTDRVSTQLLNSDEKVRGLRDRLTSSIWVPDNKNRYTESIVPFGGPWDLSMTVFVGGVFLDNLSLVHDKNIGLKDMYESERDDIGEDILIRHTHGVDGRDTMGTDSDGAYVFRETVVNMDSDEVATFTSTADDIDTKEIIKDDYQTVVGFDSTMDSPD